MQLLLCTISLLVICASQTSWGRSFELSTSPREQGFPAGDVANFIVSVVPIDGYAATVNFRIFASTIPWVSLKVPKTSINAPYTGGITITIDRRSGHIPGRHMIIIEGSNGPAVAWDTCYLNVEPTRGWRFYNTANSPLPGNSIKNIFVDRDGTGWIVTTPTKTTQHDTVTEAPLTRFDQTNWTIFTLETMGGIPTGALASDSTGRLWVGLESGLASYRDGAWAYHPKGQVSSIAVAPNGTIWTTINRQLHEFDGVTWKEHGGTVEMIVADRNGMVWGLGDQGISTFDGTFWSTNVVAPPKGVQGIMFDSEGKLWMVGREGVVRFDGINREVFAGSGAGFPGSWPAAIDVELGGDIWVGSADRPYDYASGEGLVRYDGVVATRYTVFNSGLTDNRVTLVRAGNDGTIWLRTHAGGILLFNPRIAAGVEKSDRATGTARITEIYPNPVTELAMVRLSLSRRDHVRVGLHDALGREVGMALDAMVDQGERNVTVSTEGLSSGIYFIRVAAGGAIETKAVTIVR